MLAPIITRVGAPGVEYAMCESDIVWRSTLHPLQGIKAARFPLVHPLEESKDSAAQVKILEAMEAICAAYASRGCAPKKRPFSVVCLCGNGPCRRDLSS